MNIHPKTWKTMEKLVEVLTAQSIKCFTRRATRTWQSRYLYGLLTKCEVKMAGCWPSFFLPVHEKKEQGQYPAILTETNLVNKGSIIWLSGKCFLQDAAGSPEQAR